LEESEWNASFFRQRLDEVLTKVASLELQLQMPVINTSQNVIDPVAIEAEEMHDFIHAINSPTSFESSPMKRARTSLFAYPFPPMEGSRASAKKQAISKMRDELE
jgi:hypothetical protein